MRWPAYQQAVEEERQAAAAGRAPLAPRPAQWTGARDATVPAEYVSLDLDSQGAEGAEVEAVLQAVGRCGTVSVSLQTSLLCSAALCGPLLQGQ